MQGAKLIVDLLGAVGVETCHNYVGASGMFLTKLEKGLIGGVRFLGYSKDNLKVGIILQKKALYVLFEVWVEPFAWQYYARFGLVSIRAAGEIRIHILIEPDVCAHLDDGAHNSHKNEKIADFHVNNSWRR